MIDFKANGQLIGSMETQVAGRHIILVYWDKKYIAAIYINGTINWSGGKDYGDITNALDEFHRKAVIWCT